MPEVEVGGQRLYYEEHGEGEPLLCIMGLGADTLAWAMQVPVWSKSYRTIIFDNRDVGRSTRASDPYEIDDMAADVLGLADALELDSFHLLGVSMGGAIAQRIALAQPRRVRSLTLAVTFARAGAWGRALARTWGIEVMRSSREEMIDRLMLLVLSESFYENEAGVAFLRRMLLENPNPQEPEAFVRQLEASSRHDARAELGMLNMPTHVIGAEHDVLVPVWKSVELAELIPRAKLTIVPGAPHGINLERAEEFASAVLEFLAASRAATV